MNGQKDASIFKKYKKERLERSILIGCIKPFGQAYSFTKLTVPFAKDSTRANDSTR